QYVIRPALQSEYHVKRADEDTRSGEIVAQIIIDIDRADLVVADVSGLNPNVFYELGVAHTLGKKIIHICDRSTQLPFDIRQYRTVIFDPFDPEEHIRARASIQAFVRSLQNEPESYASNFVTSALGREAKLDVQQLGEVEIRALFDRVDQLEHALDQ